LDEQEAAVSRLAEMDTPRKERAFERLFWIVTNFWNFGQANFTS
jgi:hypothetical protein